MNISDSEKEELVEIMMKACGFASDLETAFDKMDPNSSSEYLRFRTFVLKYAETEEENSLQEKEMNQAGMQAQAPERGFMGDYSGNSVPNRGKEVKAPSVIERSADDSMERLNRQINARNTQAPPLVALPPLPIGQPTTVTATTPKQPEPVQHYVDSSSSGQHLEANKKAMPEIFAVNRPEPEKPRLVLEEDDLDFEVPGERSDRKQFDPRLEQEPSRPGWESDQIFEFYKSKRSLELQPKRSMDSLQRQPPESQSGRRLDDHAPMLANLRIPEESNEPKTSTDRRHSEIDPARLDMLEQDELPGRVVFTGPLAVKRNAEAVPVDNGEFKKFYEENKKANMGLIKEEPSEIESERHSVRRQILGLQHEPIAGMPRAEMLGDGKDQRKRSHINKNSGAWQEPSLESSNVQRQVPLVADPKFIQAAPTTQVARDAVLDDKRPMPPEKVKDSSKVVSFPKLFIKSNDDSFLNPKSDFKGPAPESLWDHSKDKLSQTVSQIAPIVIEPVFVKKVLVPQAGDSAPQEKLYTKEEVDKMLEDKIKPLNEGYANVLAEVTRLSAELLAKRDEDTAKHSRINESVGGGKPKSAIKLMVPPHAIRSIENQRMRETLQMSAENSKSHSKIYPERVEQATFHDSLTDANSETIQKIISFARGTAVLNRIDPLFDLKGVLHENEDLVIDLEYDKDLAVKEGRFYLKVKLTFRNKRTVPIAGIVPTLTDDQNAFRILAKPLLAEFHLDQHESKSFSLIVCPRGLECSKMPELSIRYLFEHRLRSVDKLVLPISMHRFMYFNGQPAEATQFKSEREVPVDRLELFRPEMVLRLLPNIQRTDAGQLALVQSMATYSGRLCYQMTTMQFSVSIKVSGKRKAQITVGYGNMLDAEASACCEELVKLFKVPPSSH